MRSPRSYKLGHTNKPTRIDKLRFAVVGGALSISVFAVMQGTPAGLTTPGQAPAGRTTKHLQDFPDLSLLDSKGKPVVGSNKPTSGTNGSNPLTDTTVHPATAAPSFTHLNIITTVFWVGEDASGANGYISNSPSAWDEQWQQHFGGVDSPTTRNGYRPDGFTPKENPFYIALPYNDFDSNGHRKSTAHNCANSGATSLQHYSWCKNTWVAVRLGSRTVYVQWQDVGPYQEDDAAYVWGKAAPKNNKDARAGLDISPAAKDYLGAGDVEKCDWTFVSYNNVPVGPWLDIVTTSTGGYY